MKHYLLLAVLAALLLPTSAVAQRLQQPLGRSVVAATDPAKDAVLITWRRLAADAESTRYNVYAGATRLNAEPLAVTNLQTTRTAVPYGSKITVAPVVGGVEGAKSAAFDFREQSWRSVFFNFDFDNTVLTPNNYRTNFARPVDLTGSGTMDAVLVTRKYAGGAEPAVPDPTVGGVAPTTTHKLQMYRLDGTLLWTLDIGPNIDPDAGSCDNITVYDINCDGRAEVILKTSDGTRLWDSAAKTWGGYAHHSASADTDGDSIVDYTKQNAKNPPYYISVLDAETGRELDCAELDYASVTDGIDQYSRDNRSYYMNDSNGLEYAFMTGAFAICYFDGIHPSLAVEARDRSSETGHHYYVFSWGYDWTSGKPTNFSNYSNWARNVHKPTPAEFHQLRVADVDGDGIDEMLDGGYAYNPKKGLVMNAEIGHGDRFDVSDIDPDRPGMEVFAIQQTALLGQLLYDAKTGEHIKEWYQTKKNDVGRGRCMDVDPTHKGYEVFSTMPNLYDCKGDVITEGKNTYPVEAIWWDGNLQRELLASPGGSGYSTNINVHTYSDKRLIQFSKESGWLVHAGGAVRPAYVGDMTGDWREEVILMNQKDGQSIGLVGYTTDIPTDYSMPTLQEDPHYRLDQTNRCYYQSPCTSFYLGEDMPMPPLPPTIQTDMRWASGTAWTTGTAFKSFDLTASAQYADGKSVVFDISGDNSQPVTLSGDVRPAATYFMSPVEHEYTLTGTGSIAGTGEVWKSMQGRTTLNADITTTGRTVISEGTLEVNGRIEGPVSLRAKGTLAGTTTIAGQIDFEPALNYEGCRLMPTGVMTFEQSLTLPGGVYVECKAGDKLHVNGDLTLTGENTFTLTAIPTPGSYVLAECTGALSVDVKKLQTRGLDGVNYDFVASEGKLTLRVNESREAAADVTWTGAIDGSWDYHTKNFTHASAPDAFVNGDGVLFGDGGSTRDIVVSGIIQPASTTFAFDHGTYSLSGKGGIAGNGSLVKDGTGTLSIATTKNAYTGATIIKGGTVEIPQLEKCGTVSALGASDATEGNFQIGAARLRLTGLNSVTDHIVSLTADTATVEVVKDNASITFVGQVCGPGHLVKEGPGQMNFNYPGENTNASLTIRGGRVSQGAWNATFCKKDGHIGLEGADVRLIDNTSSKTIPEFLYDATVKEGTENQIVGGYRTYIHGTIHGAGVLKIFSDGVRSDVASDFSDFSGTLMAYGENFRLLNKNDNMERLDLVLQPKCKMRHYGKQGSKEVAANKNIGSLSSEATDCKLGGSLDTYSVGFNGHSTTYAGLLLAKRITKVGRGTLTLTNAASTSPIDVNGGTLRLEIADTTKFGLVTVADSATLSVNGYVGEITLKPGATLLVNVAETANDTIRQQGAVTLDDARLLIALYPLRTLSVGDTIQVFAGAGTITGTPLIETEGAKIVWDATELATRGILRVADPTGISAVGTDTTTPVSVYTTDGILLRQNVSASKALDGLAPGVYLVNGRKTVKR